MSVGKVDPAVTTGDGGGSVDEAEVVLEGSTGQNRGHISQADGNGPGAAHERDARNLVDADKTSNPVTIQEPGTGQGALPIEYERKFLIDSPPADLTTHPSLALRQGYVAVAGGTTVRLRQSDDDFIMTVKTGPNDARVEVEFALTRAQFDALWPLTEGARIEKTRYIIPDGDGKIELDVYHGSLEGFFTAEREFDTAEARDAWRPPQWFGREVTEDGRYKNSAIAHHGLPGATPRQLAAAARVAPAESAAPQEIERKFLVPEVPASLTNNPRAALSQGYIVPWNEEGTTVRIRRKDDAYIFTVKKGTSGVARTEVEIDLTQAQFEALWPLTEGKRVEKTRYAIPDGDGVIELDIYHRGLRGFVTAEREFDSLALAEQWTAPAWIGEEVTEDNRYKNHSLAIYGIPKD